MSSLPLPALDIRPPQQPPNMLEQYGQLQALKNQQVMQPLQQQAMQNQVQSSALDVQIKQIAVKDQQAMQATMLQWGHPQSASQPAASSASPTSGAAPTAGAQTPPVASTSPGGSQGTPSAPSTSSSALPNYDDLIPLAIKNGASFNAVQQLQQHVLEMKNQASEIAKNDATAGSDNASTMQKKNSMIVDAMSGVMSQPDQLLPQAIQQTAQQLAQQGLFDPQHVQMAQQLAQLAQQNPAQARQQLDVQIKSLGGFSKLLEDAQKKQTIAAGQFTPAQIQQLNQALAQRSAVMHPGEPVSSAFQLSSDATPEDFTRIDKVMQSTETAQQTAAQMAATNSMRMQSMQMMAQFHQAQLQNTQNQQLNQSFQYSNNFIETAIKPLQQTAQRLGRLQETISQANPAADSLVAPELLSVMAGGQGSGLRMNEAEIARILGGATQWTALQANLNKWAADPAHAQIPPAQRSQMQTLINYVAGKVNQELNTGMQAQQDLITATTPPEHHQILAKFSQDFTGNLTNPQQGGGNPNDPFAKFGGKAH